MLASNSRQTLITVLSSAQSTDTEISSLAPRALQRWRLCFIYCYCLYVCVCVWCPCHRVAAWHRKTFNGTVCALFIIIVCVGDALATGCKRVSKDNFVQFFLFFHLSASKARAFTVWAISPAPAFVFKLSALLFNPERTILKLCYPENPDEKARLLGTISLVHSQKPRWRRMS